MLSEALMSCRRGHLSGAVDCQRPRSKQVGSVEGEEGVFMVLARRVRGVSGDSTNGLGED